MRKYTAIFLMIALLVTSIPFSAEGASKSIKLNTGKASTYVGGKVKLQVISAKPESLKKKIKWHSSNKKIATVSSKGVVKGKKPGKVTITAISKKNKKVKAKCKIRVYKATKKLVLYNEDSYTLKRGDGMYLIAAVTSPKSGASPITWSTSDPDVVIVDEEGYISAVGIGTAMITARSGSKKVTVDITVESPVKDWTVSFYSEGGDEPEDQIIKDGDRAEEPVTPKWDSHHFEGWYRDEDMTDLYDFDSPVTSDLALYAKWSMVDNLEDDQIDRGDIEVMVEEGKISVNYSENGAVASIDGTFSDETVKTASDAAEVFTRTGALFGSDLDPASSEIETSSDNLDNSSEHYFRYSPTVCDIPVFGSQIILTASSNGVITGLSSSYDSRINSIDIDAETERVNAEDIAWNKAVSSDEFQTYLERVTSSDEDMENVLADLRANYYQIDSAQLIYAADPVLPPALTWAVHIYNKQEVGTGSSGDLDAPGDLNESGSLDAPGDINSSGDLDDPGNPDNPGDLDAPGNFDEPGDLDVPGNFDEPGDLDGLDELDETDVDGPVIPFIDKTWYIYANGEQQGTVMAAIDNTKNWSSEQVAVSDMTHHERLIDIERSSDRYRMKDQKRSIETRIAKQYGNARTGYRYEYPGDTAESAIDRFGISSGSKKAISAHANFEDVYDYYKENLNRNSFDAKGNKITVTINYNSTKNNAFWTSRGKQFVYGTGNCEASLDIAAHEFTHAVSESIIGGGGLVYHGETGALNESYSDILGNLIEGKTDGEMWLIGEDTRPGGMRNMSDPGSLGQPDHYSAFDSAQWRDRASGDDGGVHLYSGIYNKAAQLMITDERTGGISREMWSELFYRSLYRLTNTASFLDSRYAVLICAKRMGFDSDQQEAIKEAYDQVGICEPDSIRVVLRWGQTPADLDSHLVGPGVSQERFHVYYNDSSYHEDGNYNSDRTMYIADLDYDDTTSFGPEVTTIHRLTPGTYYFYVHDFTNGSGASESSDDTEESSSSDQVNSESTALSESGASIKVFLGSDRDPVEEYTIESGHIGLYWNVFKLTIPQSGSLDDVSFETLNEYTNESVYQ